MKHIIELKNITKVYQQGGESLTILRDISLQVKEGEKVAIIGPSWSGKSTLMSIIAGLDTPTSGTVLFRGKALENMDESESVELRNRHIGIIFQAFELVQFFSAYENVMLPLAIRNERDTQLVDEIFWMVGLEQRKNNLPSQLSGWEQQRVAIARVLASGCDIICADEPTGNLDVKNGAKVLDLLLQAVEKKNKTLIIITHDMNIAQKMDTIYEIQDGTIVLKK